MINGYDIAYGLGLGLSAPYWLIRSKSRRKVLKALSERMGRQVRPRANLTQPAVMIHAVSLGEMNATRAMVSKLRDARPGLQFIISTTTETGFAQGQKLYGTSPDCQIIHYPLDFTAAIERTLDAARPSVVVLMELEVWPNFLAQCEHRGIPVLLVNGRLTASSFRYFLVAGPVTETMFRRLCLTCAQDDTYGRRFVELGAPRERVRVTGTMKFDNAQIADRIEGADTLAELVGLRLRVERIWVCGSTGPGEEEIVLHAYRQLLKKHPTLRLVIVPRHPQRFDEVAKIIESAAFPLVRRSNLSSKVSNLGSPPVILGDTMGELRMFYSCADVVLVGRSLVDLGPRQHGSDMIEPAALAKPVIVGPFTGNFAEVMNAFRAAGAMREVETKDEVTRVVDEQLTHPGDIGKRAQDVVRREQGATDRHVSVILEHLERTRA
jgi:3-deoxy-D-manno-octulosonic-acid transferase